MNVAAQLAQNTTHIQLLVVKLIIEINFRVKI